MSNYRHGLAGTAEYDIWAGIKNRCYNKNEPTYPRYGGRGITVCDSWRYSFTNFLADMGPRPEGMEVERKDNNGPYSPENCVWATPKQQARNRRTTRNLSMNGEIKCLAAWAEEYGKDVRLVHSRLKSGWSLEEALTLDSGKLPQDRSAAGKASWATRRKNGSRTNQHGGVARQK